MTTPLNISSDDAAFFQANTPDDNPIDDGGDSEDTEDPIGRGESRAGRLDMFRYRTPKHHWRVMIGSRAEPSTDFVKTPGFNSIPWGQDDEKKLRSRR